MPESSSEPVATGSRRDDAHLVDDPGQLYRATFLHKPDAPPRGDTPDRPPPPGATSPPVEDVAVLKDGPSVWDARPSEDDIG